MKLCICQKIEKMQKMLRSLGLGLGLETFAKFLRVLVSDNSVSKKSIDFSFGKKVSVSVSEKYGLEKSLGLVSEKSLGISFGQNFSIVIQWSESGGGGS